jgi:hypothetical protein
LIARARECGFVRARTRHVADAALQGDPSALCGGLADEGLSINRNQQRPFLTYLSGCNVKGRVTIVHRTGWHEIGGHQVFVLPAETIGPKGSEQVILDASAAGPYEVRGTLKEWQGGIGRLVSGHALPVLAISAAFAGPPLHLAGQEGGGVNIFGGSSQGKTTIVQAAASVWGRGASPGYVRAWRATANGLEGAAASASDTVLILDELSVVDARDVQAALYAAILEDKPLDQLDSCRESFRLAADGLRRAGHQQYLPLGLLTRAWLRCLTGVHTGHDSAQSDLDEAFEIAERGPMPLFMSDIHLHRARLFGLSKDRPANYPWTSPQGDLAEARRLIETHGYWRRKEELEDAEAAALGVSDTLPSEPR